MENLKAKYEDIACKNWKHLEQLPPLEKIFNSAQEVLKSIKNNKQGVPVFTQKITQILIITDALCQIHSAMLYSLSARLFYVVDPMARIGLEHAVNLIYILNDSSGQRTNELSRNFIETTYEKSDRWLKYARKAGHLSEILVAKKKLDYIEFVRDSNGALMKNTGKWPNTFERFEKCGYEAAYRTIYAMNSDSVHCLSEDMFNLGTLSKYPEQLRKSVRDSFESQNASLSIYLFSKTLSFFCIGLQKFAQLLKNDEANKIIEKLLEELGLILEINEGETLSHTGLLEELHST